MSPAGVPFLQRSLPFRPPCFVSSAKLGMNTDVTMYSAMEITTVRTSSIWTSLFGICWNMWTQGARRRMRLMTFRARGMAMATKNAADSR